MPGMRLGLQTVAQRLLDERRLRAVALLGDQVELPCQRAGQIEGIAFLGSYRRSPGNWTVRSSSQTAAAAVRPIRDESANNGRSFSGASPLLACGGECRAVALAGRPRQGWTARDLTNSFPTVVGLRLDVSQSCAELAARRHNGRRERRRRQAALRNCGRCSTELAGADRRHAGDQHDRVVGRQLHHLARGQQRPCRLLAERMTCGARRESRWPA